MTHMNHGGRAHLGILPKRADDLLLFRALKVDERRLYALVLRRDTRHVAERATVYVIHAYNMRTGAERLQDCRRRCRARSERQRLAATGLKRRERGLESIAVRVPGARVFEALR
jgi:hypothetical protein